MNQPAGKTVPCAVCGAQSDYHANWFLLLENRWLDHLKILSWHPALADRAGIQSVCGVEHLELLLLHWLTQANLDFHCATHPANRPLLSELPTDREPAAAGRLLGELAVHRNPHSPHWTGSIQALQCILAAITGREPKPRAADYSLASFHREQGEFAYAASCD